MFAIPPEGLIPLELGESTSTAIGDAVIASGYSKAVGLSAVPTFISRVEEYQDAPLLQIDTELVEGNSGGPLLGEAKRVLRSPAQLIR